jgi:hypothetical protein
VEPGEAFEMGRHQELFQLRDMFGGRHVRPYAVAPDDQRFLVIVNSPARGDLVVVENWFEELRATAGNE